MHNILRKSLVAFTKICFFITSIMTIKSKCKFRLLVNLEKIIILSSSPNNIIEKSCHFKNYIKKET